jgi:putative membrane protein PagO
MMHSAKPARTLVAAAYATMCLIWGSTWIMIKLGLRGAPPMTGVAVRFIIAAILVYFIIAVRKIRIPRDRKFLSLSLFLGVFHLSLPYVLVYWGEQQISSGLTAVLYSTMPINVALLARVFMGDPITPRKVAGILVGIGGVWVIFSESVSLGGQKAVEGIIACLASAFLASFSTVMVKKYASRYDPYATLVLPFTIAGLVVLAVAISVERSNPLRYDALTWVTVVYLAVLGSVAAFGLYFWIIKRIDVTALSYQTFIIPILAVMIGWIFLDETVTIRLIAGAALILAGIALATLQINRKPRISVEQGRQERVRGRPGDDEGYR